MFLRRNQHSTDPIHSDMITIAEGPFVMGTDPREVRQLGRTARGNRMEWYAQEQPMHTLHLQEYKIGRYPVTVGEFARFVEAGGYEMKACWSQTGWQWREQNHITLPEYWEDAHWTGNDRYPVVGMSWYTAQAYCAWLAGLSGQPYRLPTEPEWEKAARGSDGRRYPWGNRWEANYCNVALQTIDSWDNPAPAKEHELSPVGQFSPGGDSPYGCADMAGNVWEWCQSPLRRYPLPSQNTASPPESTERQIVRGGSWYHGPDDARCTARYCYYPSGRDNVVGFRLAL